MVTGFSGNGNYSLVIQKARNSQVILHEERDFNYYMRLIRKYSELLDVKVFAFCILPHSIYFVLRAREVKDLSAFMSEVNQSYRLFFKSTHERNYPIWQRSYKSLVVDSLPELCKCVKFVEFKPVKLGLVDHPARYPWSSYSMRGVKKGERKSEKKGARYFKRDR